MDKNDDTQRIGRKRFRLDLSREDRIIGAAVIFVIFAVAHRELTGLPAVGVSAADLALFYTGFLMLSVLGSLLAAALVWFAAYVGCLWAGVSRRAPSFTAMLLGTSIVVCGALLYSAYCLRGGGQHSPAINPHLVGEGFRHSLSPQ
jgi:phosphoglycerol transferase MdoB-like AlkP superfamily enzyme